MLLSLLSTMLLFIISCPFASLDNFLKSLFNNFRCCCLSDAEAMIVDDGGGSILLVCCTEIKWSTFLMMICFLKLLYRFVYLFLPDMHTLTCTELGGIDARRTWMTP